VRRSRIEEILEEIKNLPADEKAQLIAKLLGQQSGLSVVFGNGSNILEADLVVRIEKNMVRNFHTIVPNSKPIYATRQSVSLGEYRPIKLEQVPQDTIPGFERCLRVMAQFKR
jgi:hypothetical protein